MAYLTTTQSRSSFTLPILSAVVIGTVATGLFYGLLLYGVIDQPLLKRYCSSHLTTMLAVWLGVTTIVGLALKLQSTLAQGRVLRTIDRMLDKVIVEGEDVAKEDRALWLEARWLAVPTWQQTSWTGRHIAEVIERQIRRPQPGQLDDDLRDVARAAEQQQRDSLSMVRTASVVVPMLGAIGSLNLSQQCAGSIGSDYSIGNPAISGAGQCRSSAGCVTDDDHTATVRVATRGASRPEPVECDR